jgi:eukaryotic-like serine/threonine-protein kinase
MDEKPIETNKAPDEAPERAASSPAAVHRPPSALRIVIVALIGLAAGYALSRRIEPGRGESPAPGGVARLAIDLPAGAPLAADSGAPALAISPRGERIVYVARRRSGTELFLRPLDSLEAVPVPGTEGAAAPFFSPDGDWVAFFAEGRLKKVPLRGGAPIVLCDAAGTAGGGWGPDGTIYFGTSARPGLFQVAAAGGPPEAVGAGASPGNAAPIRWPEVLPGGRSLLFTLLPASPEAAGGIGALHLATSEAATLLEGSGYARYAPGGHLVYSRGDALLAVRFDPVRLRLSGKPIQVLEGLLADSTGGAAQFALSDNGTLVYVQGDPGRSEKILQWIDRRGSATPLLSERRDYDLPRLSPDGRRLAVSVSDGRHLENWVLESSSGSGRRLPSEGSDGLPLWSPDGASLTYISPRAGAWTIFRRPADGSGTPELLVTAENPLSPSAWSPDGRILLYTEVDPKTHGDVWEVTPGSRVSPSPLVRTPADEWGATLSPDGRFVSYTSDESGRNEVYVKPFPGPGELRKISKGGGYGPVWSRAGSELFYRSGESLMAVPVATRPAFTAGTPRALFQGSFAGPSAGSPNYDVAPDGLRFVFIGEGSRTRNLGQIIVVLGWLEEMKRKVSAAQD